MIDEPDIVTALPTPLPLKEIEEEQEVTDWVSFKNTDLNSINLEDPRLNLLQSLKDILRSNSLSVAKLQEIEGNIKHHMVIYNKAEKIEKIKT